MMQRLLKKARKNGKSRVAIPFMLRWLRRKGRRSRRDAAFASPSPYPTRRRATIARNAEPKGLQSRFVGWIEIHQIP
jgi:hypothetical protein